MRKSSPSSLAADPLISSILPDPNGRAVDEDQRNMNLATNGFLIIDKPEGMTSHDVVAEVRRLFNIRRAGHLGTLDPMATGVLPLALGKATRLARFMAGGLKAYRGIIQLGFSTNTYDREGAPSSQRQEPAYSPAQLEAARRDLLGKQWQVPPPFSAVKVGGVRAYQLARQGEPLRLNPRCIQIHEFELAELAGGQLSFEIHCSPGTYVRAVAQDIGCKLGCGAHLASLRRTIAGEFSLSQAISLEALAKMSRLDLLKCLLPLQAVLLDFKVVRVCAEEEKSFLHGQTLWVSFPNLRGDSGELVRVFTSNSELLGLAEIVGVLAEGNGPAMVRLQPKVVLA